MQRVWYRYNQFSKKNYSSFKQVMEKQRVLNPAISSQRKHFHHTSLFPRGFHLGYDFKSLPLCESSHCVASVGQKLTTVIREKRSYQLLPQVLACTAGSSQTFCVELLHPGLPHLVTSSRESSSYTMWGALAAMWSRRTAGTFAQVLLGRLNLFLSSALSKAAVVWWS